MATVLALVTDAHGGFGGISQFNRDFLSAVITSKQVDRVVVVPRLAEGPLDGIPRGVEYRLGGIRGIRGFSLECAKVSLHERPDAVICGHVNLLPIAAPVAAHFRVPLALITHGIEVWNSPKLISRTLMNQVDYLASVSQFTVDQMSRWTNARSTRSPTIIPNTYDQTRFQPSASKPQYLLDRYCLHGKAVIMTLARLVAPERYKGVREVLDSIPALLDTYPNLVYLVVGGGSDLECTKHYAYSRGLAELVVFTDRISEREKLAHYQLADAFVMPGRGEGFGIVYLEALACGIPVVASILDGSREAVRLGLLGELCDPRDPRSLVEAENRALKKGRGSPPPGLEFFSLKNFQRRVVEFVERMLTS